MTKEKFNCNILERVAYEAMKEKNFLPDFPKEVLYQVDEIKGPLTFAQKKEAKDLRSLFFISIDNDDSKDLDQLSFAKRTENGEFSVLVAIADVDALVAKDSPIDDYAAHNTTSVYTPTKNFPMLPPQLSTNFTSLCENEERLAIIFEMTITREGIIKDYNVFHAFVRNHAKLAYNQVTKWLLTPSSFPDQKELRDQVVLHDEIAQILKQHRALQGTLHLEPTDIQPIIQKEEVVDVLEITKTRGTEIIEELMIAANESATHFLHSKNFPILKRIVRTPKKWDRIVAIAKELNEELPAIPEPKALREFLVKRSVADPLTFPDLSLAVIKLLGRGEYVVQMPNDPPLIHFGLAIKYYSHATAPNRRFADLVTQRLIKAALQSKGGPYKLETLSAYAERCTEKENDADKIERRVKKSAAALLLVSQVHKIFDGIVTGASSKGTWVRIFKPPVEGRVIAGYQGLDVGHKVKVKLLHVDPLKGHIDFTAVKP